MPFLEIEMFFMIGCVLGPLSRIYVFASDEKADWNCLFKILAFSVGSACKTPSLLRGAILVFSFGVVAIIRQSDSPTVR